MSHKWGQVLLRDGNMIAKILRTAALTHEDSVVEIGCGDGSLSVPLSQMVTHLDIIEIDPEMISRLMERLDITDSISIHQGDILEREFTDVRAPFFRIVANLPYYITTKIIKVMIRYRHRILSALIMVQDEFAQKLVAAPRSKHYVSLTLYAQYYFDIQRVFKVPRQCFQPIPGVDSAMVRLIPRERPFIVEEDRFFSLIRAGFAMRRKRLINGLIHDAYWGQFDWTQVDWFVRFPNCRAEELTLSDFYCLYTQVPS